MKQWTTVLRHKGYEIQTLDGADAGDCMDYRIQPPISEQTYPTIGDAIAAIDSQP